jgi:hypothetical protein
VITPKGDLGPQTGDLDARITRLGDQERLRGVPILAPGA